MSNPTVVIAGAGLAGATCAIQLRERGFAGRILLLGAEEHHPYIRPPLSKDFLMGRSDLGDAYVKPGEWYPEHEVEFLPSTEAGSIDPAAHELFVAGGGRLTYDSLVIATGARPRTLEVPGSGHGAVFTLRTVEDSQRLYAALELGRRHVVVVGSGWIGLEVAAAASGFGNKVTIVGRQEVPLGSAIGPELGGVFEKLHRDNGVDVRNGSTVVAVDGGGQRAVVLASGEHIPADVIVTGLGAIPNTRIAEQAGIPVENGILTDQGMRTSVEDVLAVGDVANPVIPAIGGRFRNEHWANAIVTGRVAAQSILGEDASYDEIPYFYSDQYDLGMEYSGYPSLSGESEVVFRGDVGAREFIAFWLREDRVVGGMNVNVWDVQDEIKRLIRSEAPVDRARLVDESVDLAEL